MIIQMMTLMELLLLDQSSNSWIPFMKRNCRTKFQKWRAATYLMGIRLIIKSQSRYSYQSCQGLPKKWSHQMIRVSFYFQITIRIWARIMRIETYRATSKAIIKMDKIIKWVRTITWIASTNCQLAWHSELWAVVMILIRFRRICKWLWMAIF